MKRTIAILLALALCIPLGGCGGVKPEAGTYPALAAAVYPEMAHHPDTLSNMNSDNKQSSKYQKAYNAWQNDLSARRVLESELDAAGLDSFFEVSIRQFLSGAEGENRVYSPLNVYMALAMLAELTDGESREQILSLLDSDGIEALRAQASAIWNANYLDDGATSCVLASSLWLNQDINFVQPTLDVLAKTYYASSYQGKMGSQDFNGALQGWLSAQTGGLLDERIGGVTLDAETVMALATTIYLRAKWNGGFSENRTETDLFHADGGDMTADFMHRDSEKNYYWGEKFTAVSERLSNVGNMWFFLPDEGVTAEELLMDGEAMEFLLSGGRDWEQNKFLLVHESIPKFDVSSDLDLIPGLMALGVTDVFDFVASDFTPMTGDRDDIYVSTAKHAARAVIDEEGVVAVAYTVISAPSGAAPPQEMEEIDFTVDRPFIFAITGAGDLPLFVGIVNTP